MKHLGRSGALGIFGIVAGSGAMLIAGCHKTDYAQPATATITISNDANDTAHTYHQAITATGSDGNKARADAIETTKVDLQDSTPSMILACINGTYYIATDGISPTVTLSPLFENGNDHPTSCTGGTVLKAGDSSKPAEHIKR